MMLWCNSNKTCTLGCLQMSTKLISVIFWPFSVMWCIYSHKIYLQILWKLHTYGWNNIYIAHTFFNTFSGGIIIYGALWLFDEDFVHVVSITFTALILTELLMVALTIRTWHWAMAVAEVFSLAIYIASLIVLRNYFGKFMTNTCPPDNELLL